jgi:hypothetical protein
VLAILGDCADEESLLLDQVLRHLHVQVVILRILEVYLQSLLVELLQDLVLYAQPVSLLLTCGYWLLRII